MLVNQQMVLADLPGLPSRDHQVVELGYGVAAARHGVRAQMQPLRGATLSLATAHTHPTRTERPFFRASINQPAHTCPTRCTVQAMLYVHDVRWKVARCRDFVADAGDGCPCCSSSPRTIGSRARPMPSSTRRASRRPSASRPLDLTDSVHLHYRPTRRPLAARGGGSFSGTLSARRGGRQGGVPRPPHVSPPKEAAPPPRRAAPGRRMVPK